MLSIYLKEKPDINEEKINNRYLYLLDELMYDLECDLARNKFNFDGFLNPEYNDLLNNIERDENNWSRCLKSIFNENVFKHSKNGKKSYTVESYTMYGQKVTMYFGLYSPLNRYELSIRIEFLEIVGSCSYLTYIAKANTNDNLYCFLKNCLLIFQYINDVILIKYNRYVIKKVIEHCKLYIINNVVRKQAAKNIVKTNAYPRKLLSIEVFELSLIHFK